MSMIQPGILADAADYIDQHGWTQGQFETDDGKVCLLGAVRRCTPIPGDRHLVEQVMHRRRRADVWNDAKDRTVDEVTAYLREHADVTDEELADTFGPQWREIVAQVRVISGATPQQLSDLAAAWDAVQKQVGPEQMYSVAYDPVHAFLAPTEKRLQEEAHALYLRMINEKLDEAATADRVETD